MSSEATATGPGGFDLAAETARRAALRLAFGVTASFAVVEALNWDVTFLAPLLAVNMIVKLPRPPSLAQGLGFIVLIALSTGAVLLVTAALIDKPTVLILGLALLLYLSFYAHWRGAPDLVTLLLQISAVSLPVIAVLKPDGAAAFATMLVLAGGVALVTVWVAHAAFPAPAADMANAVPAANVKRSADLIVAARSALLDIAVLLPVLAWFILDATEVAVVVLITIVTLLRQHDPRQGQRAALGLVLGNLIGGTAAAVAYNIVLLGDTLLFFTVVCLAASLIFAGRIVTAGSLAPIYVLAFTTFILLLGLGISPLPGGSGEAFVNRIIYVVAASAYAIGCLSLVENWRGSLSSR
jgi:hypothetical protein